RGALLAEAAAQISHFRNRETHVVGHDDSAGIGEDALQPFDRFRFLSAVHCGLLRVRLAGPPGSRMRLWTERSPSPALRRISLSRDASPAARPRGIGAWLGSPVSLRPGRALPDLRPRATPGPRSSWTGREAKAASR